MPNLTASEVTNWYLYGQPQPPQNFADENLIRQPMGTNPAASVPQDRLSYMTTGIGRFATGVGFDLVRYFFARSPETGEYIHNLAPNTVGYSQLQPLLGLDGQRRDLEFSSWQVDDGAGDYAERTYIWNTVSFEIADDARFVVTETGERFITNFVIQPYNNPGTRENFDMLSTDWVAQIGNPALQYDLDPSQIGRRIDFEFTGSLSSATYTESAYETDLLRTNTWTRYLLPPPRLAQESSALENSLWQDGTIRFMEGERPVIYGTTEPTLLVGSC
jgi:hypothetical protein